MQNNDIDSNNQIRTQTLTQGLSEACCHNIKEERPHSSPHHKPAHQPSATGKSLIPVNVLEALRAEQIFDQRELRKRATRKRIRSEQQRAASALKVSTFINQAQPAPTPSSVPSSPNCVTARVSEIVAERDLTLSVSSPLDAIPPSLHSVRIDDLDGLFCLRHQLSPPVRKALETCFAKIHWKNKDGSPGFFNKAVHKNRIPLDKHLAILCHAADAPDEDDLGIRQKLQCICECGLYSRLRKGKWICGFCCQDNHRCGLCNFKNIKDGLKTLLAAYSSRAYARGGTWFAITVSPRRLDQPAAAQAGTITPADWTFDASGFKFEASRPTKRIFVYPTAAVGDGDLEIQILTRQFLGAAKKALKNLYSSRRVDGLRARLENSIAFMPYADHWHWHLVANSVSESNPQALADFLKADIDALLVQAGVPLCAAVCVKVIPSAGDLRRWIRYMNKIVNLTEAVQSAYDRQPTLTSSPQLYRQLITEVRAYLYRDQMLFKGMQLGVDELHGFEATAFKRTVVYGTHKFGNGSVLSESKAHRRWRDQHRKREKNRRVNKALNRALAEAHLAKSGAPDTVAAINPAKRRKQNSVRRNAHDEKFRS